VDPNHTVIVAVENPNWDATHGYFGSETVAMYNLFAMLAEGRPSVTVVANGGEITLTEIDHNIRAGRPLILVSGSGRAADTLVSMLNPLSPADSGTAKLRAKAETLRLLRQPRLFHVFDMARGPGELADTLRPFLLR
jgi:ABC-type proline/glycine betaine transport system ATPase subunit